MFSATVVEQIGFSFFYIRSMEVYECWHWFTSSTILGLVSLQYYRADPQGHKMAAADPVKQDKDSLHYQAFPTFL